MDVGDEWTPDGAWLPVTGNLNLMTAERRRDEAVRHGELVVARALTEEMSRIVREGNGTG